MDDGCRCDPEIIGANEKAVVLQVAVLLAASMRGRGRAPPAPLRNFSSPKLVSLQDN